MAPIDRSRAALVATLLLTGLLTGGLLIGIEPVGGDPDTMYRPIKMELASALMRGTLPFWSDRFGVGVPLVAESHAAAFYPPNWLFYRLLPVHAAYRVLMWLHYLLLAGGMYAYARILGLSPWGGSLAAVSFTFCGFQASHAIHEPFYHALAYVPLAMIATERYLASGRLAWLVGIAACWGLQLTLGHFQIQAWTGGLVLFVGGWRIVADRRPWWRAAGLVAALVWGGAIAAVQLALTKELVDFADFNRELRFLLEYSLPWQHWAQLAFPRVFMRLTSGVEDPYWAQFHTNEVEACFYVGVIPLILAILGLWSSRGGRTLRPWLVIGVAAVVLATMPHWWPAGYEMVLKLPGIGLFRCPGRYTMLTSLALSLYAGRGVDIITGKSPIGIGLILAALTAILAGFWIWRWAGHSGLGTAVGEQGLRNRMLEAALVWCVGLALVAGVRVAWLPPSTLVVAAALELGWLYYTGPTVWGWTIRLPDQSPILTRLRHEDGVQLVAGPLHDLPVQAGLVPAFPYLGIPSPPNNYLFDTVFPERTGRIDSQRWMRRFGVSHGVWEAGRSPSVGETVYEGPDQALDRIIGSKPGSTEHRIWRIVRYPEPLPPAHVTVNAGVSATWSQHLFHLDRADLRDAWYLRRDAPPEGDAPWAKNARLLSWDGVAGEIEHDGTCDLIIRRAFYPGWTALVDGRDANVHIVNGGSGGIQAIRLYGAGRSRVSVRYHPQPLRQHGLISLFAVGLAAIVAGVDLLLYHHRLASRPRVDVPGRELLMRRVRFSSCPPWLVLLLVTGALLGGLLVGVEPISGDPDRLYRPIKLELAAALRQAALPFWSDRFGLGVPLAAESHAAAFYPPNWLLYRALSVSTAYRLAMWLHYLALAAGTYGYARLLKISSWGSALAALCFTFCGFQAIHSSHEPFYNGLAYLPVVLLVVNRYVSTGQVRWLALLAVCLGMQLAIGHFQIQVWTALLALGAGCWQIVAERRPPARFLGLCVGVAWGVAIAAVQLLLTAEFVQHADWGRGSIDNISFYSYPPAHWAELAIPWLFQGLRGGPENAYWFSLGATGFEACFYIGTIPLVLALVGLCALRGDAMLRFWALVVLPLSLAMATLPHWALVTVANWWTVGYLWLLQVPGLGAFRAPARYTLLASLALALLAGRGFDRAAEARIFARGLVCAIIFAIAAGIWALLWTRQPLLRSSLGTLGIEGRLGEAALAWIIALVAIVAWRQGRLSPLGLLLVTGVELGALYYTSTTDWGWSIRLPEASPVLSRLAAEGADEARVACALDDLPVRAGAAPLVPYLAVSLPPIGRFVRPANSRGWTDDPRAARWLRRYGTRFGIWDRPVLMPGADVLLRGHDETLDRLAYRLTGAAKHPTWTLIRYPGAFPQVRVVTKVFVAPDLRTMSVHLSEADRADEAWFLAEDLPEASREQRARTARIRSWKGLSGEVEHDGACYLLVSRTYYPGWTAQLNGGPPIAVSRAEGGIQAILIPGSGLTRISLRYEPTWLKLGLSVSTLAAGSALLVLAISLLRGRRKRQSPLDVTPPALTAVPAPPPPPAV